MDKETRELLEWMIKNTDDKAIVAEIRKELKANK